MRVSLFFAAAATAISLAIAVLLALFVDRRLTGHQVYQFTFFLPYALAAPAVGLAFRFIFSPDAGFISAINRVFPDLWNPALDGYDAMTLIVARAKLEDGRLQLHLLPGGAAVDPAHADRGRRHGRRRRAAAHARHPAAADRADACSS